jgi:hypothetical protein
LSLNLWIYFFDVWCCRVCTAIRHISSLFSAIPLLSAIQILNFYRPFFGVDCVVVPFTIIKHQSRKRKRKEKKMHRYGKRERHAMTMRTEKCTRYTRDWFPPPPARFPTKNKKWKMKTNRKEKTTTVFSRFIIPFFVFFVFFFVHCTFLNDHKRRLSALVDRRTHLDSRRWNSFSWIIPSIFSGSFVFWCFPPNPKRRRRKRINKMKFRWFSL